MTPEDFYKEARFRGFQYTDSFQSVVEANVNDYQSYGEIQWNNNYVTFIDNMLQFNIILAGHRDLILPTSIQKLSINPKLHEELAKQNERFKTISDNNLDTAQSGGIEMSGFKGSLITRRRINHDPILEIYTFVSHFTAKLSQSDMAKFCGQLILENSPSLIFDAVEIDSCDGKTPLIETINEAILKMPMIMTKMSYLTEREIDLQNIEVVDQDLMSLNNISVIIKSGCINDKKFLEQAYEKLDVNGHLISREPLGWKNSVDNGLFNCIAIIEIENEIIYLMKTLKSKPEPIVNVVEIPAGFEDFKWIDQLKIAVIEGPLIAHSRTDGKSVSGIMGLINCLRREPNGHNIRCVLIDDQSAPDFNLNNAFYAKQLNLGHVMNVYKDGQWGSYKHLDLPIDNIAKPQKNHCFANVLTRGDMSSVSWITGPLNKLKSKLVEVHYSALNFKDIMLATGRISLDFEFKNRIDRQYMYGFEFSGITSDGRRVMGVINSKAFSTYIDESEATLIEIPDSWTLEEAATVPVVYMTVYEAFFSTTNIQKNKSILIHAGSGAVGQAAIRVAFAYGLKVFTTVSTEEKKRFLLDLFPKLKIENIGNSRNTSFEQMIMTRTDGKGVDFVMNSLAEELMQASVRCVAKNGVFLEVGKFDMLMRNKIQLHHFLKGITFKAVLLDSLDSTNNLNSVSLIIFLIFSIFLLYIDFLPANNQKNERGHKIWNHTTTKSDNL